MPLGDDTADSHGTHISGIVGAPGGVTSYTVTGILSTMSPIANRGDYDYNASTSMTAPHVSGLAALIWSQFPALDHHQVKARILNSVGAVSELETRTISGGKINAYNALINPDSAAIFSVTARYGSCWRSSHDYECQFRRHYSTVTLGPTGMQIVSWDSAGKSIVATVPLCIDSGEIWVNGEGNDFPLTVTDKQCISEGDRGGDNRCFIATGSTCIPR